MGLCLGPTTIRGSAPADGSRKGVRRVLIKISARHGTLTDGVQEYIRDKADKLPKYFERLTSIAFVVSFEHETPAIELLVSAEHKHDFVARHSSSDVLAAVDQVIQKMEQQLRRYKEKVQDRRRTPPMGAAPEAGGEAPNARPAVEPGT